MTSIVYKQTITQRKLLHTSVMFKNPFLPPPSSFSLSLKLFPLLCRPIQMPLFLINQFTIHSKNNLKFSEVLKNAFLKLVNCSEISRQMG